MIQNINNDTNSSYSQQQQISPSQWSQVVEQLFDKLVGKNMFITHNFENLEIDILKSQGPGGRELCSAVWTTDSRIVITTETHQASGSCDVGSG